ncbi:MAG: M48 family metalloprotease [Flavobacteriales bacterium]|nr:M48 family metalloprotease [Flavobacteriales bacterium]
MRTALSRSFHILLWMLTCVPSNAQDTRMSERAATEAVRRIVQYSGLTPDITVREDPSVRTANAYIKGHVRVIAFNPAFITTVLDSSKTNWAAISILAHEVAHHLLGHTLDPSTLRPGDELACDHYSGFILFSMGASLPESLAAIEVAGNPHGTWSHPPKHARSAAIEQGWREAERLRAGVVAAPIALNDDFRFVVRFVGDRSTYYVDRSGALVWFNTQAEPIAFGTFTETPKADGVYQLNWEDQSFFVDRNNAIWRRGEHGLQTIVGRMEAYARP